MSSSGKRRPTADGSTCPPPRRRRRRRTDSAPLRPPPPPPEPLIRLLQSDKGVLAYFQSLQANLDADVQRWKDRAANYKEKCEQLQTQLSETSPETRKTSSAEKPKEKTKGISRSSLTGSKSNGASKKKRGNDDLVVEESHIELDAAPKPNESHSKEATLSIDDAIFEALDEESSVESVPLAPTAAVQEVAKPPQIDLHETYKFLCESYNCLKELGVSLVTEENLIEANDKEPKMTTEANVSQVDVERDDENAAGAAVEAATEPVDSITTRILLRRSDHDVVSDLMHSLRTVTRVHLLVKEAKAYHPFTIPGMIPCCYSVGEESSEELHHPAAKAMSCAFRALSIMDAYCGVLSDSEWNALFTDDSEINEAMRVGMRNRRNMVEMVIGSLHGEISSAWPVLDRSSRLITTAQHYQPAPKDNNDLPNGSSTKDSTFQRFGAKSQSRLASLAERCIHAQLVSNMTHHRWNPQEAAKLVWNYLLSATPSLGVEDYPRLPPVLSLCVVEALLHRDKELLPGQAAEETDSQKQHTWFSRFLKHFSNNDGVRALTSRAVALSIHTTAQIWKTRFESEDDRITDISRVELASYRRLLESQASWLGRMNETLTQEKCREMAMSIVNESVALLLTNDNNEELRIPNDSMEIDEEGRRKAHKDKSGFIEEGSTLLDATFALQLALIIFGDHEVIKNIFDQSLNSSRESLWAGHTTLDTAGSGVCALPLACCISFRQIRVRQVDSFRLKHGTLQMGAISRQPGLRVDEMAKMLFEQRYPSACFWNVVSSIGKCCVKLAHGETLYRLLRWLVINKQASEYSANFAGKIQENESDSGHVERIPLGNGISRHLVVETIATLTNAGQVPTVRVINLRRRSDRMDSFLAQAQHEQILVVRAVASLDAGVEDKLDSLSLETVDSGFYWGLHAFDGQGRAAEVDARLSGEIGDGQRLKALVDTYWRPNDLKAFDKDAPGDEKLVMASPSERACALSHIASWKGVARSLSMSAVRENEHLVSQGKLFPHPENLLRLFRVSGFAHGPPLLIENERMPPAPVCVILEDDAILVDRFTDRLSAVLEELPRDFHFCSLGYSRPKTAPMVKYSSQLGIPSCTWYLTGYVLSMEGAKFLMDSLPVKGPVDSWIGLKMCANWDNVFGEHIGVGVHSRPLADLPPRKDLVKFLKFRAFSALVPLCSQKVGTISTAGSVGRTWRQRDTDITYSGNS